jgi:acyl-coenzyme A thioesterase PaaI-like protein
MDTASLQAALDGIAADYTRRLNLRVTAARPDGADLTLPVVPDLVHAGGVVCGQSLLAAADTAMLVAMIAVQGGFRPMTTVQLGFTFLRPVPADAGEVALEARVLRTGKSLCYGTVDFRVGGDGKVVGQATTSYALLEAA